MNKHIGLSALAVSIALSGLSSALHAEDTSDPNKLTRSASVNRPVQPIQYVAPIQPDPLKQYEDAMRPIYNLTIQETTVSLKKKPRDGMLLARRAGAYFSMKDYKNALPDYSESLKLNPNQPDIYSKRAISNFMLKNYEESWKDVHKAESKGASLPAPFIEALKKTSGRNR